MSTEEVPGWRPLAERRRDTERRLADDKDIWVASASLEGKPYLVPLTFDWDGEALLVVTPSASITGRNLAANRTARLGLGHTRDVTMIDATVEVFEMDELPEHHIERYISRTGWDPREETTAHTWFRFVPTQVQAWREVEELVGRHLMRDGRWVEGGAG